MCPVHSYKDPLIENQDDKVERVRMWYEDIATNIRLIYLSGRLDVLGVDQIESSFTSLASNDGRSVIVDLSRVELMNSVGLGMMIRNANTLAAQGKAIVLLTPAPRIKRVIEIASIDELIPIEYNLSAALKRIKTNEETISETLRSS